MPSGGCFEPARRAPYQRPGDGTELWIKELWIKELKDLGRHCAGR